MALSEKVITAGQSLLKSVAFLKPQRGGILVEAEQSIMGKSPPRRGLVNVYEI